MAKPRPDIIAAPLQVSELFYSIQGESTYAGYPCVFIRLAGCNLRCSYCDARFTYEEKPRLMAVEGLLAFTRHHPAALVQITGGEPLMQEQVYFLLDELMWEERLVLLETNGSISLRRVPAEVVKIMDLKCPDSGMADRMHFDNLKLLTPADELKCVISSRRDYEWAVAMLRTHIPALADPAAIRKRVKILFSPVTEKLSPSRLAQWLLDDGLQVRLQIQLHRSLWPKKIRAF
ncbi:MAG: radical SAM protein [Desulfobulbaceae bacterium]|nr:radical SAM protein [Desulfobulbaceae bacterium]